MVTPLPESRATARRREENVFGVLNVMGGLAGGRVRSRNRRGIPKKKSCSLNSVSPALRVIRRQGEFDFQWNFERIWLVETEKDSSADKQLFIAHR